MPYTTVHEGHGRKQFRHQSTGPHNQMEAQSANTTVRELFLIAQVDTRGFGIFFVHRGVETNAQIIWSPLCFCTTQFIEERQPE